MRFGIGVALLALSLLFLSASLRAEEVDRVELKKALKQAGYYHDNPNKPHPKEVEAAIRHFESDHGMPVTGQVSPALLDKLGLGKPTALAAPLTQSQPQLPAAVAPTPLVSPPSAQLGPFMGAQLGVVLAPLDHDVNLPRQQAVELREKFADEMAKAAEPQKPMYKQAALVMDTIVAAMDEREKALTEARHSSMPGVQDTHDARVSARGRHARAAVKSERMENNRDQQAAQQKSQFLEEGAMKQWADRTNVLRQTIDRAYAVERDLERPAR
jgi:peptidoglycan hydrolase-like protein with peptidoglycan-binding domain